MPIDMDVKTFFYYFIQLIKVRLKQTFHSGAAGHADCCGAEWTAPVG